MYFEKDGLPYTDETFVKLVFNGNISEIFQETNQKYFLKVRVYPCYNDCAIRYGHWARDLYFIVGCDPSLTSISMTTSTGNHS